MRTGAALCRSEVSLGAGARVPSCGTHGGDQLVAVEGGGGVGGHDLAVAHDDDAVGILEDLAEEVGDQDAAGAAGDDAADERQQLAGGVGSRATRSARPG